MMGSMFIGIFNIIGFSVGVHYQNATCYADAHSLPLSTWLIAETSVTLIAVIFGFVILLCKYYSNKAIYCTLIPYMCIIIMIMIVSIVLNIMGIVEIGYQFKDCVGEVNSVAVISIIVVVVNFITYMILGCSMSFVFSESKVGYQQL